MKLNRTGSNWTNLERDKINENWDIIEGSYNDVVGTITDEVVGHLIDSAKLIWKEPVDTVEDLPASAEVGETRMVRETDPEGISYVYRYDGEKWEKIQAVDVTLVNEVDRRLTAQLAKTDLDLLERGVNVSRFGKIGGQDDRPAIQAAIDYAHEKGLTKVFLPPKDLLISSEHPDKSGIGIFVPPGVSLEGIPGSTRIFSEVQLDTLFLIEKSSRGLSISNIRLHGTDKEFEVRNTNNGILIEKPSGYLLAENIVLQDFEKGLSGSLWASSFIRCSLMGNDVGVDLFNGTSLTFISTGVNGSRIGFNFDNVNYSSFVSSYAEQCDLGFNIENSNSVSFLGCGSEFYNQVMRVKSSRNIEVGAFVVGARGVGGDINLLHKFAFEFIDIEGGYFYGSNQQSGGKTGVVLFDNTKNFMFRHGRIPRHNARFIKSEVATIDVMSTNNESTYYIDPLNGVDFDRIKYNGNTPETAVKSFGFLLNILPRKILHDTTIVIMGDLYEEITLGGFNIHPDALFKITSYNASRKLIDHLKIGSISGRLVLEKIKSSNEVLIKESNFIQIYDCENNNTIGSGFKVQKSNVTINSTLLNCQIGINADRLSMIDAMNNEGSCQIALYANRSFIFKSGSTPSGTENVNGGGKILS